MRRRELEFCGFVQPQARVTSLGNLRNFLGHFIPGEIEKLQHRFASGRVRNGKTGKADESYDSLHGNNGPDNDTSAHLLVQAAHKISKCFARVSPVSPISKSAMRAAPTPFTTLRYCASETWGKMGKCEIAPIFCTRDKTSDLISTQLPCREFTTPRLSAIQT
jgi:hypothetical protein